jgi:hypothetical protein
MQANIDELNEEEAIADSDYFKDNEGNSTLGEDVTSSEMDELAEYFNCEMEVEPLPGCTFTIDERLNEVVLKRGHSSPAFDTPNNVFNAAMQLVARTSDSKRGRYLRGRLTVTEPQDLTGWEPFVLYGKGLATLHVGLPYRHAVEDIGFALCEESADFIGLRNIPGQDGYVAEKIWIKLDPPGDET